MDEKVTRGEWLAVDILELRLALLDLKKYN
jgi:hypothetical protein